MNPVFRILLVFLLHVSCFLLGFSLFDLTGSSQIKLPVSEIVALIKLVSGIAGVLIVSYYSEEIFWKTCVKLFAYSLQWFFLLLSLAFLGLSMERQHWYLWLLASILSGVTALYWLAKIKNCNALNQKNN
jgi:hypothetical protein